METLLHPVFDEIREESCKLPNGNPLPELFNFTPEEISQTTSDVVEQLIPPWYKKK
jgi:hypothetical protein